MSQRQTYQLDKTCITDRLTNGKWVVDLLCSTLLQITDVAQKMAKNLCKADEDSSFLENLTKRDDVKNFCI